MSATHTKATHDVHNTPEMAARVAGPGQVQQQQQHRLSHGKRVTRHTTAVLQIDFRFRGVFLPQVPSPPSSLKHTHTLFYTPMSHSNITAARHFGCTLSAVGDARSVFTPFCPRHTYHASRTHGLKVGWVGGSENQTGWVRGMSEKDWSLSSTSWCLWKTSLCRKISPQTRKHLNITRKLQAASASKMSLHKCAGRCRAEGC